MVSVKIKSSWREATSERLMEGFYRLETVAIGSVIFTKVQLKLKFSFEWFEWLECGSFNNRKKGSLTQARMACVYAVSELCGH